MTTNQAMALSVLSVSLSWVVGCDALGQVDYNVRVTDLETGSPIVDACVSSRNVLVSDSPAREQGRTDGDGRVTIVDGQVVPPVTLVVFFSPRTILIEGVEGQDVIEIEGRVGAAVSGERYRVEVLSIEGPTLTGEILYGPGCGG